jgi:hypothetical protein
MRYRLLAATALAALVATPALAQVVVVGPAATYDEPYYGGVTTAPPYAYGGPVYGYEPGYVTTPRYHRDANGVLFEPRRGAYAYEPYPAPIVVYRGGPRSPY